MIGGSLESTNKLNLLFIKKQVPAQLSIHTSSINYSPTEGTISTNLAFSLSPCMTITTDQVRRGLGKLNRQGCGV